MPGQEAADVLQFPHPGDGLADPARLEIGQRQAENVAEQAGAQFHVDLAGGVREEVGAQAVERHLEQGDGQQANGDDLQGGQAVVDQDLVHHNLEEQRGHEREHLDEERHHKHFEEYLPVLDHRRHEPAEVELRQIAQDRRSGGGQEQAAAIEVPERIQAEDSRPVPVQVLDENLRLMDLGDDEMPAIGLPGQRRQ